VTVSLHDASLADKPVLRRLLELYQHDFSEFEPADLDEHGLFGYRYLDQYWTEPGRHPFLIHARGKLAGFALVNEHAYLAKTDHALAEFFVVRRYRGRGVGRAAATAVFERLPGVWEVPVSDANEAGRAFWRAVIGSYTGTTPEPLRAPGWDGVIFQFMSPPSA
jgi:predicted acetyltransferase